MAPPANYINVMKVMHTSREFYFDFAQGIPNTSVAALVTRIVTSPAHAKAMLLALKENIEKYEKQHGVIQDPEQNTPRTIQ